MKKIVFILIALFCINMALSSFFSEKSPVEFSGIEMTE